MLFACGRQQCDDLVRAGAAVRLTAWRAAGLTLACATALWAGSGCAESRCGGEEPSADARAPSIERFELDRQLDGDPWTLIFGVTFSDPDGDLGVGQATFFLNEEQAPTSVTLADALVQSGLALDAQSGEFGLPLRFGDDLSDDADIRLGLQLLDGAGRRSNCYTLGLNFQVEAVALFRAGP